MAESNTYYLSVTDVKAHLNIDSSFTDDDTYIQALIEASEQVISKYIDFPLENLEDEQGNIPRALKFAMLLWIGTIYSTRESISSVAMTEVPHSFELLANLYRDYKLADEKSSE